MSAAPEVIMCGLGGSIAASFVMLNYTLSRIHAELREMNKREQRYEDADDKP